MSDLTFRKARPDELNTALALLKEAALWLRGRGIDYWRNWLAPPPAHVRWIEKGFQNGEFFLVERGGELIGCFRLQWKDKLFWGERPDDAGYVHSITTRRRLAGTGTGRRILARIESLCRENGKRFLRLDCGADNPGLRRYYESLGFEAVGETVVAGERLTLYEKSLAASVT